MRWEKDDNFIEICRGVDSTSNRPMCWVESNAFQDGIPVEWRDPVPAFEEPQLIDAVQRYADRSGYKHAKPRG